MLPKALLEIITSYVDKFDFWESLPDPKAVHKLIRGSDQDIIRRVIGGLELPMHMSWEILTRFETNRTWLLCIPMNEVSFDRLDFLLTQSVAHCWQTHAVFWLFIQKPENIYHGCYTRMFEESLLYQLLNIVTMENSFTEQGNVYLGSNGPTQQVAVYHLL